MPVTRHGLTWMSDETIEQFKQRVTEKRKAEMAARVDGLAGEAELLALLEVCREQLDELLSAYDCDALHLQFLTGMIAGAIAKRIKQ